MRSNGEVRDLRLPLDDGQEIQILTTRDREDPDALYVLRHSAAHLLAEAARRLYPGTKVAIGPPIENGFYYDFEFPEPVGEEALERLEEEVRREIAEGRTFERREIDRDEARRLLRGAGRALQGRARRHGRGRHLALRAGRLRRPLPGTASPGREAHQGRQAHEPRRGLLARRRDEAAAHPRLRHGLLRPEGSRGVPAPARGGPAPRPPAAWAASSTSSISTSTRPAALLAPERDGDLERPRGLRQRENARRGYAGGEDSAPLRHRALEISGHWEKYQRQHVPDRAAGEDVRPEADELPRALLLFGATSAVTGICPSATRRPRPSIATSRAGRSTGSCGFAISSQDDAHIFCTREQIEDEIFACLDYAQYLYDLFGIEPRYELSTRPENKLGTDEEWDFTEDGTGAARSSGGPSSTS